MSTVKKILLVDDHPLFIDGLAMILGASDCRLKVEISNDAQTLLENIEVLSAYDLILIDLHMPKLSGFGFLSAVKSQSVNVVVAVISGSDKESDIERALSSGAQGYIPKDSSSEEFIDAAQQLLQGKRYLPLEWLGKIDWKNFDIEEEVESEILTPRQVQVLELMRDGLKNKQIAMVLGISVSSVKGHVEQLFKKIQVNNRTSCVQIAQERKLI